MLAKDRIVIALDYPTAEGAIEIIDRLGDEASVYKVGLELFLNSKGTILDYLSEKGKKVFLDLKFHDIPNTTAMASIAIAIMVSNMLVLNLIIRQQRHEPQPIIRNQQLLHVLKSKQIYSHHHW